MTAPVNAWCVLHGLALHDGWCALHRGGSTCDCDHFERVGRVGVGRAGPPRCTCELSASPAATVLLAGMRDVKKTA